MMERTERGDRDDLPTPEPGDALPHDERDTGREPPAPLDTPDEDPVPVEEPPEHTRP
jgi:hypothetical protein